MLKVKTVKRSFDMGIKIVGLGAGDISQISYNAVKELKSGKKIYLRTEKHPVVDILGIDYESFDSYYEDGDKFEEVYDKIARSVVDSGKIEDIVYAVPGHPRVAETSVGMVENYAKKEGVDVQVIASMSFIDAMYNYLEFDPSEGFRLLDAFSIKKRDLSVDSNIIITQVYDRYIASNIKLTLMEYYQDEQPVWIVRSAGIKGLEYKKEVELYRLDYEKNEFDHLTSIYIPRGGQKRSIDVIDLIESINVDQVYRFSKDESEGLLNYSCEFSNRLSVLKNELDVVKDDDIDEVMRLLGKALKDVLEICELAKQEGLFDIDEVCSILDTFNLEVE